MKSIVTALLSVLLVVGGGAQSLAAQDTPAQQTVEYRALRYANRLHVGILPQLNPDLNVVTVIRGRSGDAWRLDVYGNSHHITVIGPASPITWEAAAEGIEWKSDEPWQPLTTPWGGQAHSRFVPKTADTRRNNPYGDDGNVANTTWIWTYPSYLITVSVTGGGSMYS